MLLGRDAERARIGALLDAAHASRSGALIIRGEPGIGKTALLEDAREQGAGMHVLSARGVESESDLPFAALHQLVRPALHLIERLPPPQADGLRGALGLAERGGQDRFLISVACLTLLSELAEERPVLCLVDDAHWLDAPSSDALLFVARRLGAEGIAVLFAAREAEGSRFEAPGLPALELGPLDGDSAGALLTRHVGRALASPVQAVLVEQSGGNALALVELPGQPLRGAAERRGAPPRRAASVAGPPAAVPRARCVAARVHAVSPAGCRSRLDRAAIDDLARRRDPGSTPRGIGARRGSRDRDRPRHLARVQAPDAEVADELEGAADRARRRSGHAAAATAFERAARLSVDDQSRGTRLVAAASSAWDAGQPAHALLLLREAHPLVTEPQARAQLEHVHGVVQFRCGRLLEAFDILIEGSAVAASFDLQKALEMLFDAANAAATAGDYARVAEAGRRGAALPATGNEVDKVLVGLLIGIGSLQRGESAQELSRVLEAIERGSEFDDPRWLIWASGGAQFVGDKELAAEFLRRAISQARASGKRERLASALVSFVLDGIVQGRHSVLGEAAEGLSLTREAGLENLATLFLATHAWFAAVQGRGDECQAYAAEASERSRASGAGLGAALADWALAILDLTSGRPTEAATRLDALRVAEPGAGHPYIALLSSPDLVEASVRASERERAEAALAALEGFAEPDGPIWARALAGRCRALLSSGEDAELEFERALNLHAEGDRAFDRARTALLFGEYLRRGRRRVDARVQLREALQVFEQLGAAAWSHRAQAELRASGESARKRDPSTVDELTPQELQIARFVAEGLSNKEVAAQLFLSPRTIEYHLRNVFSKLGITSRTQLATLALGDADRAREPTVTTRA